MSWKHISIPHIEGEIVPCYYQNRLGQVKSDQNKIWKELCNEKEKNTGEDVFRIVPKIIIIFANWSRRENIISDLFPDKPIRQILGEHEDVPFSEME